MPLTQSELLDLVDEVNVAVAQAIASYAELNEGMVDDAATDAAREKVDRLKQKTDHAKRRLADLKDRQRHKREVERRRKEHEREAKKLHQTEAKDSGTVYLRDGSGRVIGFMRMLGKGRTDFFLTTGKLVAREVGGRTLTATGKLAAPDRQGLRVLGQVLGK
jgi:hypothetical protein